MSPKKSKGKFGKGKPKIEEKDEFVSGVTKVAEKLRPYTWRIVFFVSIVTIGIVGFSTYRWWKERKAKKATAIFVEAVDVSRSDIAAQDAEPEDPENPNGEDPLLPEEDSAGYKSVEERAKAQLGVLERLRSKYGSTGVGAASRLLEASTLLELGKYDEALSRYKAYASGDGPAMLRALAREGVGYALEAKALAQEDAAAREAGLREALAAFQSVQPEEGPRRDYALYHQARLHATLDERDRAVELFKKVLEIEPPSALTDEVNNRLAVLEAPASE